MATRFSVPPSDEFLSCLARGCTGNARRIHARRFPSNIEAIRCFQRAFETALVWKMVVPPTVRMALVARQIDSDDVLAALSVPVLMSQGREDAVILPAMGEHILATCPHAVPSWYPGIGHVPFLEEAATFNRKLMQFAQKAKETAAMAQ